MKSLKDFWEDAANTTAGVSMPADVQLSKKKKKKGSIYDGRTREARKFIERIMSRRKAKKNAQEVKESVNEAKYDDNDLVHIFKANVKGNFNAKTDKIIGLSKAPKNPNRFPNPKKGANAIMRIGDAKKKKFKVSNA